jgi:fatty acid desaturase
MATSEPRLEPSATIPVGAANGVLVALASSVAVLEFGLLPLLVHPGILPVALLLAAIVLTTPLHWGLVHESVHGGLFRDAGWNRRFGRALTLPLIMSWDMVRFGHLMHHDSNRHLLDRPEVLPPGTGRLVGAVPYYAKLLGGHAILSALAPLGVLLPLAGTTKVLNRMGEDPELARVHAGAVKAFTNAARRLRIRIDVALTVALCTIAVLCWGAWWPAFVAAIVVRFAVLSMMDNSHHYGTPIDSGRRARNTAVPRWAGWLVMNHNCHGLHHAEPHLDWIELGAAARRTGLPAYGGWLACVLRQFKGPMRIDELRLPG